MQESGSWKLAFWVMSAVCGIWLASITAAIVENDRLRVGGDEKIMECLAVKFDRLIETVHSMDNRLGRMEVKMNNGGQ